MNMLTGVPAANCPYCTKPLGRWVTRSSSIAARPATAPWAAFE